MGYRYIGSKERLASKIIDIIQTTCPNATTAIDLMAGTGLFSLALRNRGYQVTASDVMTYSYHHLVVNLQLNSAPLFDGLKAIGINGYDDVIAYLNNLKPTKGYFFKEFSPEGNPKNSSKPRMYFTSDNARKIDSIRKTIKDWHNRGLVLDKEHSLLLHDLIMAANDIANIAGTYGHYLSHFVQRATEPIKLYPSTFSENENTNNVVRRGYAEELAQALVADICYIDPPYIKRQYAANYHILETLAREDNPEAVGESGLRPWRDQYSNFCSKVKIRESFGRILREIHSRHIFISYSEDGLLTLDQLREFLSQFGEVSVHEIFYKRFKSNNSPKASDIIEYLIYLHK